MGRHNGVTAAPSSFSLETCYAHVPGDAPQKAFRQQNGASLKVSILRFVVPLPRRRREYRRHRRRHTLFRFFIFDLRFSMLRHAPFDTMMLNFDDSELRITLSFCRASPHAFYLFPLNETIGILFCRRISRRRL